jgi:hypothetical protein
LEGHRGSIGPWAGEMNRGRVAGGMREGCARCEA